MLTTIRWGGLLCFILTAAGCVNDVSLQAKAEIKPAVSQDINSPSEKNQSTKQQIETLLSKIPAKAKPPGTRASDSPLPADRKNIEAASDGGKKEADPSPHDITLPIPPEEDEGESLIQPSLRKNTPPGFHYDVPMTRNVAVDRWIEYFTGPGRKRFAEWLQRSGRFIGRFRQIFKEKELPQDLAYLALIESGFNLRARSRAGAVGPWQFMRGTARRVGLKVNWYIDERRDPEKATQAAAEHLIDLYDTFGDWYLALASYNAGENRIKRAMRITRKKTYWRLVATRHLPNETRNYVPKYLAGLIIAKQPAAFGFAGLTYDSPKVFETVTLSRGISLREAARISGVKIDELTDLNTEFFRRVTPPGPGHILRLPQGKAEEFKIKLAKIPHREYSVGGKYKIRPGDTFGAIAHRFGVSLQTLLELNANLNPRRLRVGTMILLPPSPQEKTAALQRKSIQKKEGSFDHVVHPGENVWTIARRYGVRPNDLLRWNQLSKSGKIFPGDRLTIHR